jgi:hypothetical protein
MPSKLKWKHKNRYQRLRKEIQALEAKAKQARFRRQIDFRTFLPSYLTSFVSKSRALRTYLRQRQLNWQSWLLSLG